MDYLPSYEELEHAEAEYLIIIIFKGGTADIDTDPLSNVPHAFSAQKLWPLIFLPVSGLNSKHPFKILQLSL